jgi:hypothetical protein
VDENLFGPSINPAASETLGVVGLILIRLP